MVVAVLLAGAAVAQPPKLTHVWGRIKTVSKTGFVMEQNFNADPQSGYRRGNLGIILNSDTHFEESARQDLRVGRTVDVIGLDAAGSALRATRVTVYEGNRPVRKPAGVPVLPNGTTQTSR
jgi:hypothetical protein